MRTCLLRASRRCAANLRAQTRSSLNGTAGATPRALGVESCAAICVRLRGVNAISQVDAVRAVRRTCFAFRLDGTNSQRPLTKCTVPLSGTTCAFIGTGVRFQAMLTGWWRPACLLMTLGLLRLGDATVPAAYTWADSASVTGARRYRIIFAGNNSHFHYQKAWRFLGEIRAASRGTCISVAFPDMPLPLTFHFMAGGWHSSLVFRTASRAIC